MGIGRHRGSAPAAWSNWSTPSRRRRRQLLLAMLRNRPVPAEDLVRARQRATLTTSRLGWSVAAGAGFVPVVLRDVDSLTPWTPGTVALAVGGVLSVFLYLAGLTGALLLRRWLRTHG